MKVLLEHFELLFGVLSIPFCSRPRNRRTSWRFCSFLVVLGARSLSNMIDFNAGDGESLIHCDNMTTGGSGGVSVGTPTRFSLSQSHSSKVTRTTGIEDGEYL